MLAHSLLQPIRYLPLLLSLAFPTHAEESPPNPDPNPDHIPKKSTSNGRNDGSSKQRPANGAIPGTEGSLNNGLDEYQIKCAASLPDGFYGDGRVMGVPYWNKRHFKDLVDLCSAFGNREGNYGGLCYPTGPSHPAYPGRFMKWSLEHSMRTQLFDKRVWKYCMDYCFCDKPPEDDGELMVDLRKAAERYGMRFGEGIGQEQGAGSQQGGQATAQEQGPQGQTGQPEEPWPGLQYNDLGMMGDPNYDADSDSDADAEAALAQYVAFQAELATAQLSGRDGRRRKPPGCAGSGTCVRTGGQGSLSRKYIDAKRLDPAACTALKGYQRLPPGRRRPGTLPMSCAMEAMSAFKGPFGGRKRRV